MYLSNEECILAAERYAESAGISGGNYAGVLRKSSDYERLRSTQYNKRDNPEEYKENLRVSREAKVVASVKLEEATVQSVFAGLPIELQNALLRKGQRL